MIISEKGWQKYIGDLRKLSDKAADLMTRYLETHDYTTSAGRQAAIAYGYALAVKYGEGAAEKACQMYDAVSSTTKKRVPPAEPAAPATFKEVAKTINGTLKHSQRTDVVGSAIGRLVKRTGVDTTINNALRDGAEWAWISNGDTCSFCLTLASRGWQKASKKAIKNGHAEHIHANCDCTYAIRFDGKSTVEGYDPDALLDQYYAAEGYSSKDKINYLRRQKYAANKDSINAQKRAAFAKRNNSGKKVIKQERIASAESIIKQAGGKETGGHHYSSKSTDDKRAKQAAKAYEKYARVDDSKRIAENTGFSQKEIQKVRSHIFYKKHNLYIGYERFDPDYDMAVAWQRLNNGDYLDRDITLLRHELLEREIEMEYNISISEAHAKATETYDWWTQLMEETDDEGEPDGLLQLDEEK